MKLSSLLAAALTASTTVLADSNGVTCLKNHPNIHNAIGVFCGKSNMVIPSAYGNRGFASGGKWVGIRGTCSPAQWVPMNWCISQLEEVCAQAPGDGNNQKKFGKNGCQTFVTWAA
ncbi:hypothetical protein LTR36_004237 [Oleoguttula mirabilis]|uniref:Uncharacterized protein n=1 Tax=Oleoguttula mirabilis TaxID=1507867 RepID=A0AAV9JGM3_9PEZI|nr:hypothetical protein LTR36_004237 [Oleoguttula mirabilis]